MEYVVIGLGSFLGANTRYLVAGWAAKRFGATFPYGTSLINVSGSFILGFFMAFLRDRAFIHPNYRLFFAAGFLGAYTTFSTFMYESLRLLPDGSILLGVANILGSMVVGLFGVLRGLYWVDWSRDKKQMWIPVIAQSELTSYHYRDTESVAAKAVALLCHSFGGYPLYFQDDELESHVNGGES